jgi:hypothetical protein
MKQNLVVFLADLFNVLEIHPVKCVRFPGTDKNLKEGKTLFVSIDAGMSNTFSFTGVILSDQHRLHLVICGKSFGSSGKV